MKDHDIIVFVGLDALEFGALIGIGAAAGVGLALLGIAALEKALGLVARKPRGDDNG